MSLTTRTATLPGNIKSIRQSKLIPADIGSIPAGWNFAQFGINLADGKAHNPNDYSGQNGGIKDEETLGLVYQVRSNFLELDIDGKPVVIKNGGYILCQNILQYLEVFLRDLDKIFDFQGLSTAIFTHEEKTKVSEGLYGILKEMMSIVSDTNKTTEETKISSLISQQLSKEILKGIGCPAIVKKFKYEIEIDGVATEYEIPYHGVADGSPTISSWLLILLENIALNTMSNLKLKEQTIIKNNNDSTDNNIVNYPLENLNDTFNIIQDKDKQKQVLKKPII